MNASQKILLFKGKKHSDGTYPIQLQLHVSGESPQRKGIYKCLESDWDKKKCRLKVKAENSAYANNFLSEEFSKYERKLLLVLKGEVSYENFFEKKKDITMLEDVFLFEINRFKAEGKPGSYKRTESFKNEFKLFKRYKINIDNINLKWYEDLAVFMANEIVKCIFQRKWFFPNFGGF